MDDFEKDHWCWLAAQERGTWREELRSRYAPWLDELIWGFEVGDGWREIITELTAEIADGPDAAPDLAVVQVKEKLGGLRYYTRGVPALHEEALGQAIRRAEERSFQTCEACGAPGDLRQSRAGYWQVTCAAHIVR